MFILQDRIETYCKKEIHKYVKPKGVWAWIQLKCHTNVNIIQSLCIDFKNCIFYIQVFPYYLFDWQHFYKVFQEEFGNLYVESKIYTSDHSLQIDCKTTIGDLYIYIL